MTSRMLFIRSSEIMLKGNNRPIFERALVENCTRALFSTKARVVKKQGKIYVELSDGDDYETVVAKLKKVFGIAYIIPTFLFSLKWSDQDIAKKQIEGLADKILPLIPKKQMRSFKVDAKRTDKQFPVSSAEICAVLGKNLAKSLSVRVDVKSPDLTVFVDVEKESCFVYFHKIRGFGGFPIGVSGKALSLLSSGFDSPIASFLIAKRGVEIVFVHFHSYPQTSIQSIENVKRIVSRLAGYGLGAVLYLVPFLEIQKEIALLTQGDSMVLLYRRSMLRIATLIAKKENIQTLITGESVAQVASQTLENIFVINEATYLTVLRPLAGHNKEEIIALAHNIGTYELSAQPYDDCCSLFVPKHPKTKGNIESIKKEEARVERLLILEKEAFLKTEKLECPIEI